ncbi:MAG TPA: LysM domain-containing protein [Thioploca sp.]|nr:LysM domain-containing protein [Thioploca sp.]
MPGNNNFGLTYIVRPNDTLDTIANQYNIPYQNLAKWNNISPPYEIYIGQALVLYPQAVSATKSSSTIKIQSKKLGALNPELPQDSCGVSVVRIKTFYHKGRKNRFCGLSACVGASYIIKNNSAQARIIDITYASDDEERVLHRALKIEGQSLFTDKVYDVGYTRDSWNIVVTDCFW